MMRHHRRSLKCRRLLIGTVLLTSGAVVVTSAPSPAQSPAGSAQRARPPQFEPGDTSRIFFDDLKDAFRGPRPSLAEVRQAAQQAAEKLAAEAETDESGPNKTWTRLVSAVSLEDEIKRVKLRYDGVITSPGAFKGGGYQDARLNLSILATLFAIIAKYDGDVRWKEDAPAARDLIARTARNSAAGSTQVYNEAKRRKADLQDLVSGAPLTTAEPPEADNDWFMIVDRVPMMQYVEELLDRLSDNANSAASAEENQEAVRRNAELIAVVGEVLVQEGLDDGDDPDYADLSRGMTRAARKVVDAIDRKDFESIREHVGSVTQSCSDCHDQYR